MCAHTAASGHAWCWTCLTALLVVCIHVPQVEREQRLVGKWRRMLGRSAADFDAYCKGAGRMKKVKGRVRKGIPDEFRGYVWQLLSGATRVLVC